MGGLLNTGDARGLELFRAQYREGVPDVYVPPLDDLSVVPATRPTRSNTGRIIRWPPTRWAWVIDLANLLGGMPDEIQAAVDQWRAVFHESFTPNDTVRALGVQAVTDLAEREWSAGRTGREHAAVVGIGHAIFAVAPAAYAKLGDLMVETIADTDEDRFRLVANVAGHLRGWLDHVEGRSTKPRRERLGLYAIEWILAQPGVWYASGRPKLTAAALHDHGDEWQFGCYVASDVVDHLVALGARRLPD